MFKKIAFSIFFCAITALSLFFTTESIAATISLQSGWNLLSSRIEITVADTFSDGNKFASVWKWENNNWAVYLPDKEDGGAVYAESKGFNLLEEINPGEGFWVNCSEPITLNQTELTGSSGL